MDDKMRWSLISVKGVAVRDSGVVLARNSRNEWDLPGGKLELGETLVECLEREFIEELGLQVSWGCVIDVVHHHFYNNIVVVIVGCDSVSVDEAVLSEEHSDVGWFKKDQLDKLHIVPHYLNAAKYWLDK